MPDRKVMNALSGSTIDFVNIRKFSRPEALVQYCRGEDIKLISLELPDENMDSTPLAEYEFDFSKKYCIIAGHETIGIPADILFNSERVYIPMMGVGFCLNTSQALNVALYEASKQYGVFLK